MNPKHREPLIDSASPVYPCKKGIVRLFFEPVNFADQSRPLRHPRFFCTKLENQPLRKLRTRRTKSKNYGFLRSG
jgi:hypothetical protein